jgi:hypothetical protein
MPQPEPINKQSSAMWTEERRAQHTAATKGLKRTEETRRLISEVNVGLCWMANGERCVRVAADQIESHKLMGFRPGRK